MSYRRMLALMLSALLALAPLNVLGEAAEPQAEQTPNPFLGMEIKDLSGEPFDVSVFDGKPFMLNIWATRCPPCMAELPDLSELAVEYADRITIVGLLIESVVYDVKGEARLQQGEIDAARAVYEELGISYPSLIPNDLMMSLVQYVGVQAIPTTVFVAGDGALVDVQVGGRDKAHWIPVIDAALQKMEAAQGD